MPPETCRLSSRSWQDIRDTITTNAPIYYADGTLLTYDEDYETNAFPLDGMRKVTRRICLAGGIQKAESMLAAARAGYYTVLITDSQTARRLYQLVRSEIMK